MVPNAYLVRLGAGMDWFALPVADAGLNATVLPIALSVAHANLPSYLRVRAAARRVVVLADGEPGPLLNRICGNPDRPVEVVDMIDLGDTAKLEWLANELQRDGLRRERISGIIVGSGDQRRLPTELLLHCRVCGIPVLSEAGFWEREARRIDIDGNDASWFLCTHGFRYSPIETLQKRVLDVLIATALLVLTLPLMLLVALLIRCDSRGPLLYRQERVGLGG